MADERPTTAYILIAVAALGIIVAVLLVLSRPGSGPVVSPGQLSEEQKNYLRHITVTSPKMSAAENFLGDTVTYFDAELTNRGDRVIRQVELRLEFVDMLSQVVLRETVRPITSETAPLKAGETRAFQVSFEHMPAEWNQGPPVVTPVSVSFR